MALSKACPEKGPLAIQPEKSTLNHKWFIRLHVVVDFFDLC
jgi:hypothetical protein